MPRKKKNITIKDIAKKAGVAHSTVSLVMNNKGYVSDAVKKKVLKTAKSLGYEPNLIARGLINKRFPVVAAIFPENPAFFTITYFVQIISGIQDVCKDTGNALMIFNLDQTQGESYYQISRKWLTNNLIIMNIDYTRDIFEDIKVLKKNNISFVLINKYLGEDDVSYINIDNFSGVHQALKHLIDLGHTEIGLINGDVNAPDGMERFEAFKQILKQYNLEFNPEMVYEGGYFSFDSGEKAALQFLNSKKKPTAVFSASDNLAIGFMRVIKTKGFKIPEDLSLVSFDDSLEARYVTPRLTTVRQPLVEIGREAARLVLKQSSEKKFHAKHVTLKTELIVRESTRALK
jgi:DNA-binding LacI/PurR family transcriptional regulator